MLWVYESVKSIFFGSTYNKGSRHLKAYNISVTMMQPFLLFHGIAKKSKVGYAKRTMDCLKLVIIYAIQ
jgi:hypothetical protein